MTYRSMEDSLSDLETILQDNLKTTLTAVASEHTSAVALPAPSDYSYFVANSVDTIPDIQNLPAIVLIGWNESIALEGEQGWDLWNFDQAVRLWASDSEAQKLNKRIYRYADAIVRLVRNNYLDLQNVKSITDLRVDYSSVSPTDPLYQALEVSFVTLACREY